MSALRRSEGVDAFGTSLSQPQGDRILRVDLTDPDAVVALLQDLRPETIYHLAAFASPALSYKQPVEAVTSTLTMQINLYQACLSLGLKPRILVVGSGQIYGMTADSHLPLTETSPMDFSSPYSVAKAAQENLVSMYAKLGLESVVARPFNHIGPGQQPGYLIADLSKQIAELERGDAQAVLGIHRIDQILVQRSDRGVDSGDRDRRLPQPLVGPWAHFPGNGLAILHHAGVPAGSPVVW